MPDNPAVTTPQPARGSSSFQDPTIQEFAARFERGVPEPLRRDYQAVVTAGLKLMFSETTSKFILEGGKGLTGGPEDVGQLVQLTQRLLSTLWAASKERMKPEAAAFGIQMLALHGLDFYDRIKAIQVTPDFLGAFWTELSQMITQTFGLDQAKIAQAIRTGRQELMGQPAAPGGGTHG